VYHCLVPTRIVGSDTSPNISRGTGDLLLRDPDWPDITKSGIIVRAKKRCQRTIATNITTGISHETARTMPVLIG
jgi:hypothetical protein